MHEHAITIHSPATTLQHPLCELHLAEGLKGEKDENHKKNFRKLVVVLILCCIMMTVELVGGYLANSLAVRPFYHVHSFFVYVTHKM